MMTLIDLLRYKFQYHFDPCSSWLIHVTCCKYKYVLWRIGWPTPYDINANAECCIASIINYIYIVIRVHMKLFW